MGAADSTQREAGADAPDAVDSAEAEALPESAYTAQEEAAAPATAKAAAPSPDSSPAPHATMAAADSTQREAGADTPDAIDSTEALRESASTAEEEAAAAAAAKAVAPPPGAVPKVPGLVQDTMAAWSSEAGAAKTPAVPGPLPPSAGSRSAAAAPAASTAAASSSTGLAALSSAEPDVAAGSGSQAWLSQGISKQAGSTTSGPGEGVDKLQAQMALLGVVNHAQAQRKNVAVEQMISLKPTDDERTIISKKVSWILRHGAKRAGIEQDGEGWVKLEDLMAWDLLSDVPTDRLESIIMLSNEQKARYDFKDTEEGRFIRAVNKTGRVKEHKDRSERRSRRHGGDGNGIDSQKASDWQDMNEELSFQQQLQAGYQPLHEGGRVVAMVKDGISVRPGRGAPDKPRHDGGGIGRGDAIGYPGLAPQAYASYPSHYRDRNMEAEKGGDKGDGKGYNRPRDIHGHRDFEDASQYPRREPDPVGYQRRDGQAAMWLQEGQGRGEPRRQEPPRLRWRAVPGQDIIVRAAVEVESDQVGVLEPSSVVIQIGEEVMLKNGIVRIQIQAADPKNSVQGWVTRTAEAAGGPIFFKPERGGGSKGHHGRGKGDRHGGKGYGKARRPVAVVDPGDL